MYKVFINDSSLEFLNSTSQVDDDSGLRYRDSRQLEKLVTEMEKSKKARHINLYTDNTEELWRDFLKFYRIIEAAGGVVKNDFGEILMIYRLNKWDLPKGKLEGAESVESAAVREVREECGISGLRIVRELPVMYHTYMLDKERILKRTYWFEMHTEHHQNLIPQIEEHIEQAQWVNPDFLNEYLGNTYASINWLLKRIIA